MQQPAEGGLKNGPRYHLPLFDPGLRLRQLYVLYEQRLSGLEALDDLL